MKGKHEERKHRKRLKFWQYELDLKTSYLFMRELEFDRKMRNKALRMARKRKLRYIQ